MWLTELDEMEEREREERFLCETNMLMRKRCNMIRSNNFGWQSNRLLFGNIIALTH